MNKSIKLSGPRPKYTQEEYSKILRKAYRGKIINIEPYVAQRTYILHKCNDCGHEWKNAPGRLLRPDGTKKAKFGCLECAKGQVTNSIMSKSEFIKRLHTRIHEKRQPELRLIGKYRGINIHIHVECKSCGLKRKVTPKSLLTRKSLCPCQNPKRNLDVRLAKVGSKESKRLGFLYKSAFLNIPQLSILTGYRQSYLRKIGNRDGWIEKGSNKFKNDRKHRMETMLNTDNSITKKAYTKHARKITSIIYSRYKHIIDPDSLRGSNYVLDHLLSISDAYSKPSVGPMDLRYVCHPANLKIVTKNSNLTKHAKSEYVSSLKQRIEEFENTYGCVDFPKNLRYKYRTDYSLDTAKGIRVLGFDPGPVNFGCFAGTIVGTDKVEGLLMKESSMLEFPIKELTGVTEFNVKDFIVELKSFIDTYQPHALVIERFMTRGFKGKTIELVCMMIGVISGVLSDYESKGKPITMITPTAASWKNQVNRIFDLKAFYKEMKQYKIPDHQVDACLMSLYIYPSTDKSNPYAFLSDPKKFNKFVSRFIEVQHD